MKQIATGYGRQAQSRDFVDNLYKSIRKKTATVLAEHNKIIALARTYIDDGLEPNECVELLMIESNISREAAANFLETVQSEKTVDSGLDEYSFRFEDIHGKTWSSYDIGSIVKASSEEDAWQKAEEMIDVVSSKNIEAERILSVEKIIKAS